MPGGLGSDRRRFFDRCRDHGTPLPRIDVSEHWVKVTVPRPIQVGTAHDERPSHGPDSPPARPEPESAERPAMRPAQKTDGFSRRVCALLARAPVLNSAIAKSVGQSSTSGGLNRVIRWLRQGGSVEFTFSEEPNSGRQEYRLSKIGRAAEADHSGGCKGVQRPPPFPLTVKGYRNRCIPCIRQAHVLVDGNLGCTEPVCPVACSGCG